jgi:hypothetical protein
VRKMQRRRGDWRWRRIVTAEYSGPSNTRGERVGRRSHTRGRCLVTDTRSGFKIFGVQLIFFKKTQLMECVVHQQEVMICAFFPGINFSTGCATETGIKVKCSYSCPS